MTSITLIGPGAIGGSLAGALFSAGHRPRLSVRTPFERLRVEWPGGDIDQAVMCTTDPAQLEPADVVIVAAKATHNTAVAEQVLASVRPGSVLVIAQNGVDHLDRFADIVDPTVQLLPAIPMLPCHRTGPGQIVVEGPAKLTVPASPAADTLASLFADTYVEIEATEDWTTAAWFKLVMNAASGGVGVLTRRGSEIYVDAEAQQVLLALMEEVVSVGQAEGAQLADDLATKMLTYQVKHAGSHTTSIVVDRLAGTPTEWRERNEIVVTRAAKHGIDVPMNRTVATLMRLGEPEWSSR